MKTLTSTLEAAQRANSGTPYIEALVADYDGYVARARPERVYTGSEQVLQHAAAIAGDGSLIRVRLETTGTDTLYVSRVTNPGAGSTFSSWTSLTTNISATAGVAVAVHGSNVYVFCVQSDNVSIRVFTSTDNGATFDGGAAVATAGAAVGALAAAASVSGLTDGDLLAVWVEGGTSVYRARHNGTSWGARTASTQSFHAVSGLALTYLFDWQVIITGQEQTTQTHMVWATRYGDGFGLSSNSWGSLVVVTEAAKDSGLSFKAPSVSFFSDAWRVFFVEAYSGSASYERQQWAALESGGGLTAFNSDLWREPVRFDYEDAYGLAVTRRVVSGTQYLWLTAAAGAWLSAVPAYDELDVSADVVGASVQVDEDGGVAVLELDNADGAYTAYGSGSLGALQRGGRLQLSPGYVTSAGAEVSSAAVPYTYWIETVELVTGARPRLRLRARDGWSLLRRWRAARQFTWALGDKTVGQLVTLLTGRASCEHSNGSPSPSATYGSLKPAFTVHAGESALTAVRRLGAMVEDVFYWDGATLRVRGHSTSESATYELGGAGEHTVVEAVYVDQGPPANRARVVGAGVYADVVDFAEAVSAERVALVVDVNLDASAEAEDRGETVIRKSHLASRDDELELFGVHCGVELWDVVQLTDAQAGLSAAKRRVRGYGWLYRPERGDYSMSLRLGAT